MQLTSQISSLIELALSEDIVSGDITCDVTIPSGLKADAVVIAREQLVVCGLQLIDWIITIGRFEIEAVHQKQDGDTAAEMEVLCRLKGNAGQILTIERTILNFLQRMCGVASYTNEVVKSAKTSVKILDTRKTMPGWRTLDKYAVRTGGGYNHRLNLADMILIKNNHIDIHKGDMKALFRGIQSTKPFYTPVQVEVRNEEELKAVLAYSPNSILLDNMDDQQLTSCVGIIRDFSKSILIEASGNITQQRIPFLEKTGVDCISLGALTTKANNKDISLRIEF